MLNFDQTKFKLNIYAKFTYVINLVDLPQSVTHPNGHKPKIFVSVKKQQFFAIFMKLGQNYYLVCE